MSSHPPAPSAGFFKSLTRAALAVCAALLCAAHAAAQGGPVLITEANSTRAVALESVALLRDPFPVDAPSRVGTPDGRTRVTLFAMNVELYAGEGPNAFVAEAEDAARRVHRLTVEAVRPVPGFEGITQLTLRLDEPLRNAGDVLVRVSLRGMTSNRVRISVGRVGGGPPDAAGSVPTPAPATPPAPRPRLVPDPYTGPASAADTVRFLEQATWGPTQSEVERVRAMGLRAFLDEQFALPASSYPTLPLVHTDVNQNCLGDDRHECLRDNYTMFPLQTRFFRNAFYRPDQLRQRTSFALHQLLVVSGKELNQASYMATYLQVLDRNAFGNFRQLLFEVTLNAAMGDFQNTANNTKERPNENFAREFLQLFTVGPDLLNMDGTPKLDLRGNRVPTYDQRTVVNFARVFTGWHFAPHPLNSQGVLNFHDPMVAREELHETGAKTLLNGVVLPAGRSSLQDLNDAIDNAFNHPNTPPFVSKRLIRHLVTSNPSPAYVERVARVFANNCAGFYPDSNCTGERGDLKATVRAVLLDPEARGDFKTDPSYGRLREPAQLIAGLGRALPARGVQSAQNPSGESDGVINHLSVRMQQDVFKPPTVFGYFPAEYDIPSADNLKGPEFGGMSSSTALARVDFISQMFSRFGVERFQTPDIVDGTFFSYSALMPLADDPPRLVALLDALFLHGTMSPEMRAAVIQGVEAVPTSNRNYLRDRTREALFLVLSSPQYQIQR